MADEQLIQRIRAQDWNLLEQPARVDPSAAPAIVAVLGDGDRQVRELAIHMLHRAGGPVAKDGIFKALHDEYDIVRAAAARYLHNHCQPDDVGRLVTEMQDNGDEYVREQVALLLGKLGQGTAVEALQQRLEAEDRPHARRAIELALVKLGDATQREAYLQRLRGDQVSARVEAVEELLYLRKRDLAPYVATLLNDFRDGKNVGPSHGPYWIRVCDVAVNVLDDVLDHPFTFEVRGNKRYEPGELREAEAVLRQL